MALLKGGNPALTDKIFDNAQVINGEDAMTVGGAYKKFGMLLLLLLGGASYTWTEFARGHDVLAFAYGSLLVGFVLALVIIFKQSWSVYLAPVYAIAEGLFLGAISAVFNAALAEKYPGIVMQAVGLTFGVAIGMFALYYFRILKATPLFTKVIIGATLGIALFYVLSMVLRLFGVQMPYLYDSSMLGIGISLFVVAIAALNLILDFDRIEKAAAQGAPKYFEWYSAFGLMVTIVWLYLEILKLLSRLARR